MVRRSRRLSRTRNDISWWRLRWQKLKILNGIIQLLSSQNDFHILNCVKKTNFIAKVGERKQTQKDHNLLHVSSKNTLKILSSTVILHFRGHIKVYYIMGYKITVKLNHESFGTKNLSLDEWIKFTMAHFQVIFYNRERSGILNSSYKKINRNPQIVWTEKVEDGHAPPLILPTEPNTFTHL